MASIKIRRVNTRVFNREYINKNCPLMIDIIILFRRLYQELWLVMIVVIILFRRLYQELWLAAGGPRRTPSGFVGHRRQRLQPEAGAFVTV